MSGVLPSPGLRWGLGVPEALSSSCPPVFSGAEKEGRPGLEMCSFHLQAFVQLLMKHKELVEIQEKGETQVRAIDACGFYLAGESGPDPQPAYNPPQTSAAL